MGLYGFLAEQPVRPTWKEVRYHSRSAIMRPKGVNPSGMLHVTGESIGYFSEFSFTIG